MFNKTKDRNLLDAFKEQLETLPLLFRHNLLRVSAAS